MKTPKSEKARKRMANLLAGGVHYNFYSRLFNPPVYFSRGYGGRVWDVDENEYLDLYCKFGAAILGHNDQTLLASILSNYAGLNADSKTVDIEVCEKLAELIPAADSFRFGVSGTEIVQLALRVARAHTQKNRFIRFIGHYHGSADNIMGGRPESINSPIPTEFIGDFRGTKGRATDALSSQSLLLPWNDIEAVQKAIDNFPDEICAILLEPICINGGGFFPDESYLLSLRGICDRHGIILIYDEIITGFRVHSGGAQGLYGVTPDLSTFGKAISCGITPVSVLAGRFELMGLIDSCQVTHAGTYNGYTFGMHAVLRAIDILNSNSSRAYQQLDYYGGQIRKIITERSSQFDIQIQINGPNSAMFLHYTKKLIKTYLDIDERVKKNNDKLRDIFFKFGIILAPPSRMYVNVNMTDEDLDFFDDRICRAFDWMKNNGH